MITTTADHQDMSGRLQEAQGAVILNTHYPTVPDTIDVVPVLQEEVIP